MFKGETRCKEVKLLSPGIGGPFGWHLSFLKGGMAANLVAKQCWGNGGKNMTGGLKVVNYRYLNLWLLKFRTFF